MNTSLVAIIVLNWNGRDLTLQCLQSLQRLRYRNVFTLVVDNGSGDGSVEAVRSAYPGMEVLALSENLGYAGGNNAGLEAALKHRPEWVMFLNNDTEVDPHLLDTLLAAAGEHPDGGVFGPKIYYGHEPHRLWYAGGEVSLPLGHIRHRGIRAMDQGRFDEPGPTDFVSGCCLLIRAGLARRLGGFDPAYTMYTEDVDLCRRANLAGSGSYYVPQAKVWHHLSASMGGELSLRKVWLKWRSSLLFLRRYARPWHWPTILGYQLLYYGIIGPIRYLRRRLKRPK